MSRESVQDKAARLFVSGKWERIRTGSPHRLELHVLGDSADPLHPEPYVTVIEWLESGRVESCTCAATKTCSHIALARHLERGIGVPVPRGM